MPDGGAGSQRAAAALVPQQLPLCCGGSCGRPDGMLFISLSARRPWGSAWADPIHIRAWWTNAYQAIAEQSIRVEKAGGRWRRGCWLCDQSCGRHGSGCVEGDARGNTNNCVLHFHVIHGFSFSLSPIGGRLAPRVGRCILFLYQHRAILHRSISL